MPQVDVQVDVVPDFATAIQPEVLARAAQVAVAVGIEDQETAWESAEMSIRVTTDDEIQTLNREYRHVDHPTDVLSFAFLEDSGLASALPDDWPAQLGEVILSFPYAERQAADLGHSVDMELAWLTIHGTLQLLGYSHETDSKAERMEGLERSALRSLGFILD